jgi:hypothetical protein
MSNFKILRALLDQTRVTNLNNVTKKRRDFALRPIGHTMTDDALAEIITPKATHWSRSKPSFEKELAVNRQSMLIVPLKPIEIWTRKNDTGLKVGVKLRGKPVKQTLQVGDVVIINMFYYKNVEDIRSFKIKGHYLLLVSVTAEDIDDDFCSKLGSLYEGAGHMNYELIDRHILYLAGLSKPEDIYMSFDAADKLIFDEFNDGCSGRSYYDFSSDDIQPEEYSIDISHDLKTNANLRDTYVGGNKGFSRKKYFSIFQDRTYFYLLSVYWYCKKRLYKNIPNVEEYMKVNYGLIPTTEYEYVVYDKIEDIFSALRYYKYIEFVAPGDNLYITNNCVAKSKRELSNSDIVLQHDMLKETSTIHNSICSSSAITTLLLTADTVVPALSTNYDNCVYTVKWHITMITVSQWLKEGYVAVASKILGITNEPGLLNELEMLVKKVNQYLLVKDIKSIDTNHVSLAPQYQSSREGFGKYEVKERSQSEKIIIDLCKQSRLSDIDVNYIREVGRNLEIKNIDSLDKEQLCTAVLNQYELEFADRQKFKELLQRK